MSNDLSIRISFADLWATNTGDDPPRLPLSQVTDWEWHHIHGTLRIEIGGRALPHLGYWGPDDACFDTWPAVLRMVVDVLAGSMESEYIWDEGEQGQPAFRFVRKEDVICISIVQSSLSDGESDPEWQDARCAFSNFCAEVNQFLIQLRAEVGSQTPVMADSWWECMITSSP